MTKLNGQLRLVASVPQPAKEDGTILCRPDIVYVKREYIEQAGYMHKEDVLKIIKESAYELAYDEEGVGEICSPEDLIKNIENFKS